ncbi:DUF4279 domain-containing protein [Sporosarcina siberiensis]|uniref:DUF4279 domain-containing protein n=1 Tax=Sporosarcina siberiensis TaxID=1365606 RepID=A0ABW4SIP9_9BACL
MNKKTTVEVYLDFRKFEPDWDFSLTAITDKLEISPTETVKVDEWATSKRRSTITQWQYSTGVIETTDFEKELQKVVSIFKNKVDIINELKDELGLKTSFCAVTNVYDGRSPGYSFPIEVMKFAVSIDTLIEIDEYVYGFSEDDLDDE